MAGQRERIVVHLLCVVSLLGGFSFGAPPVSLPYRLWQQLWRCPPQSLR
jgi:hypothetical protein